MTHYTSPAAIIGKHEWRVSVIPSRFGGLCTTFEWRGPGSDWRDYHDWPGYNINDGTYAGCPRSMGAKLVRWIGEAQRIVRGEPEPQLDLLSFDRTPN